MADNKTDEPKEKNFFEKLSDRFFHDDAPETQKELLDDLHIAHDRKLLTDDGMHMIEGVMRVNSLRAEDLMVPRTQMIVIDISENSQDWIKQVIEPGTLVFLSLTEIRTTSSESFWQKISCAYLLIPNTKSVST